MNPKVTLTAPLDFKIVSLVNGWRRTVRRAEFVISIIGTVDINSSMSGV
jgi:hypothetical protein